MEHFAAGSLPVYHYLLSNWVDPFDCIFSMVENLLFIDQWFPFRNFSSACHLHTVFHLWMLLTGVLCITLDGYIFLASESSTRLVSYHRRLTVFFKCFFTLMGLLCETRWQSRRNMKIQNRWSTVKWLSGIKTIHAEGPSVSAMRWRKPERV